MKYYLNRHRLGVQMMIVALLWLLSSGALTTTGNLVLVNYLEKRLLMTSPKAGATIAAQLVFQREGVLEKARKCDPFIHTYRIAVYNKERNHRPNEKKIMQMCGDSDALCFFLVRTPLDRIVSSYIHTMRTTTPFPFKIIAKKGKRKGYTNQALTANQKLNVTFAGFVSQLDNITDQAILNRHCPSCNHFLPQSSNTLSKIQKNAPGKIKFITTECLLPGGVNAMYEEFGYDLREDKSSSVVAEATAYLEKTHYIEKNSSVAPDDNVASWPFSRFTKEGSQSMYSKCDKIDPFYQRNVGNVPDYKRFLDDSSIAKVVCRLFTADVALYRTACRQQWLRDRSAACATSCDREVARLDSICGLDQ